MLVLNAVTVLYEINEQHRQDEAYRAEYTDRRKILDRIFPRFFQCIVGDGIGDGDGRHKERDAKKVAEVEDGKVETIRNHIGSVREGDMAHCIPTCCEHEKPCKSLAEGQDFLRRNPLVCDDAHQCGHEHGYKTLGGKEQPYLRTETGLAEKTAH